MRYFNPIVKVSNEEVSLVALSREDFNGGAMSKMPIYEGYAFYETEDKAIIDYALVEGKELIITGINECAFSHCSKLKDLYISKFINKINWNMYGCINLQNIHVDSANPNFFEIKGVLYKKQGNGTMCLVGFPCGRDGSFRIEDGTVEIGNCSFKSCKLSEIIIPDSVEIIGVNAFYECNNLKEIILPQNIKTIKPNNNRGQIPIKIKFYLKEDINKQHPYTIQEVVKMFPENSF